MTAVQRRIAWVGGAAAVLAFAFPLFLVSVRHWASVIYYLAALLALAFVRGAWPRLSGAERGVVLVLGLYFSVVLVANTLNGWAPASLRWGEADLRFLLAIPLFLFLRQHPAAAMALFRGVPVAAVLVGLYTLWEYQAGSGRVQGIYGPIFLGKVAALLAVVSIASLRLPTYPLRTRLVLHLAGAVLATVAVLLSGTRGAWVALAVTLPLAVVAAIYGIPRRRLRLGIGAGAVGGFAAVIVAVVVWAPNLTQDRLQVAVKQAERYFAEENPGASRKIADQSVGRRFEQWRLGLRLFQERPLFGYGVGNIGHEINRHVAEGSFHRRLALENPDGPTHLHSAYVDAMAYKGAAGLLALLLVLTYPMYLALRAGPVHPTSGILLVHGLSFVVFGLTEDPFIRNNFSSIYLLFLACALAVHFALLRGAGPQPTRAGPSGG